MTETNFTDLFAQARQSPAFKAETLALEFIRALETRMDDLGLSRTELAARTGVSKPYITKLFRGDGNFTLETMVRFAAALDLDLHLAVSQTGQEMRWLTVHSGAEPTSEAHDQANAVRL